MRRALVCIVFTALLLSCQSQPAARVTLLVDGHVRDIATSDLIPAHMLEGASISFSASDRILVNGIPAPLDQPIQSDRPFVLQLRRAVPVTVIAPNGQITISSAAFTVAEALREAGLTLGIHDRVEPPAQTFLTGPTIVTLTQAREIAIQTAAGPVRAYTSAATVGTALAEAGIPLVGLDQATPSENDAFPSDGQVRVKRVSESIQTAYKGIPYETELIVTAELEPPQQDVLEPGAYGLSFNRTRIRYEDGVEISRAVESESIIRPPETRVVRSSYWAALQMYATSYSPCRSGVAGKCFNGTSSGLPVQRGVVAVNYDWYLALQGTRVFIPGYGPAVIGDVCGGCVGQPWIDLAFTDADYEQWSTWVTVYFVAPAPLEIPWFLK